MTHMNHTPRNDKRSQKNTAPTQNTHTREFNTWYHTVRLHSKLPRQRTVATASTAKPRGAATTAADFTAVPPLLPIDIDNQQHCYLLLAEALAVKKLNNNSITRSSMERQAASLTVVPSLICVPPVSYTHLTLPTICSV